VCSEFILLRRLFLCAPNEYCVLHSTLSVCSEYGVSQCDAVSCSVLQYLAQSQLRHITTHYNTLQHAVTHCNTYNRSTQTESNARHCQTLPDTARHCKTLPDTARHCKTLQNTTTHCKTLQDTARRCKTLQDTSRHCKTLQDTARHCKTLQDTARHCIVYMHVMRVHMYGYVCAFRCWQFDMYAHLHAGSSTCMCFQM